MYIKLAEHFGTFCGAKMHFCQQNVMQKYIFAQQNVRKNAFLHHKMQLQEKPIGVKNREVI